MPILCEDIREANSNLSLIHQGKTCFTDRRNLKLPDSEAALISPVRDRNRKRPAKKDEMESPQKRRQERVRTRALN